MAGGLADFSRHGPPQLENVMDFRPLLPNSKESILQFLFAQRSGSVLHSSCRLMNPSSPESSSTPFDAAIVRLRAAGLRVTQPRILILNVLLQRVEPATIEQIAEDLKSDGFYDLVTVYRCVAVFEELGLVRRSFLPSGTSLFQLIESEAALYHVVCRETEKVEPLDAATHAELDTAVKRVEETLKSRGYTDVKQRIQFFGVSPGTRVPVRAKKA